MNEPTRTAVPDGTTDPAYDDPGEIGRNYPLLWRRALDFDFAERLGGCNDPLLAEIDAILREVLGHREARAAVARKEKP